MFIGWLCNFVCRPTMALCHGMWLASLYLENFIFFCAMALQCAIQISILNFWQRPNVQWHHTNFEFLVKANCAATALECATEISILNFWQRPNEQRQHD